MWLDLEMITQVATFANAGDRGLKSRFTHPSMSSDGLGRHLGRIQDVEVQGDQAIGDLHLAMMSHDTPDGDLADYVMDLASEDPEMAGLSIVFDYDYQAMEDFHLAHGAEWAEDDWGKYLSLENFDSPDELNTENLVHVRMSGLRAADIVDEPAANEGGLFDRQSAPRDADRFLAFVARISEEDPGEFSGIDPDRARAFLGRWLTSHGLHLTHDTEPPMATQTNPEVAPEATPPTLESYHEALDKYTKAFGPANGSTWFREGLSFDVCQTREIMALKQEKEELEAKLKKSDERLSSLSLGEAEPIDTTGSGGTEPGKKRTLESLMSVPALPSRN